MKSYYRMEESESPSNQRDQPNDHCLSAVATAQTRTISAQLPGNYNFVALVWVVLCIIAVRSVG